MPAAVYRRSWALYGSPKKPWGRKVKNDQDDREGNQVAHGRGEDRRHEDLDESEQKSGQAGAQDRASPAEDGRHEGLPSKEDAHIRIEHRIGDAEKNACRRRQGRTEGEGEHGQSS